MPNIQIVKENSLGLNRGIYADWMGNALSDANANTLLTEGAAVAVNYKSPVDIDDGITVSYSGSSGAGKFLTAKLPPEWTATGYQWYADGVAISGATNQTYLQTTGDRGKTLTVKVSGLSYQSSTGVVVQQPTTYLGHVTNAARISNFFSNTNFQFISRAKEIIKSVIEGNLRPTLSTLYCLMNDSGLERPLPGNSTYRVNLIVGGTVSGGAIVGGGNIINVTYNGSRDIVVPPGVLDFPLDEIPGTSNLPVDTVLWWQISMTNPNGIIMESNQGSTGSPSDSTAGEQMRYAASGLDMNLIDSKGAWTGGTQSPNFRYGPTLVLANTKSPSVYNLGTSISVGQAESAAGTPPAPASGGEIGDRGILARAIGRSVAVFNGAQGGSTISQFLVEANRAGRMSIAKYFSHVVTDHMSNDIRFDAITAAQAVSRAEQFIALFPNHSAWVTTQPPHVSGAVTLADGTDQTPTTVGQYGSKIVALNALIRTGVPGAAGYFDLNAAVRLGSDETKWFANGTALLMTPDLLHPSTYASQRVVSQGVIDTSKFVR